MQDLMQQILLEPIDCADWPFLYMKKMNNLNLNEYKFFVNDSSSDLVVSLVLFKLMVSSFLRLFSWLLN